MRTWSNAVFNEAARNKKLAESPCTDIPVRGVVYAADFVLPSDEELEALPADWAATVWLMCGCGLRIGGALAVRTRCRINRGPTMRDREQVNPVTVPSAWWLITMVLGTVAGVVAAAIVPSWLGTRRTTAGILQSEAA